MPYFLIRKEFDIFPHPLIAEPYGLLAIGGDLSLQRLLLAYQYGIFPWYAEGDPIMWWSPDPRMVLFPGDLKISKSMRSYFNQNKFTITLDQNFSEVIHSCKNIKRKDQDNTWIDHDMVNAYTELYKRSYAHSLEVWQEDKLVGGLYGVSLGKIFFGESMFSSVPNASKFGFINLVKILKHKGFLLIDCQQETKHMKSLGATTISRAEFLHYLRNNIFAKTHAQKWSNWVL